MTQVEGVTAAEIGVQKVSDARVLAELMGWKHEERSTGHGCFIRGWWAPDGRHTSYPAYEHDLNVMREVEESLPAGKWLEYVKEVILATQGIDLNGTFGVQPSYWHILTAPAKVRMEAAIKVLRKAKN